MKYPNNTSQICVSLGVQAYNSGITTEALFLQYLSNHPLTVFYELATPLQNYGVVNLGTLTWTLDSNRSNQFYSNAISELKADGNAMCSKYVLNNTVGASISDKQISTLHSYGNQRIFAKDIMVEAEMLE